MENHVQLNKIWVVIVDKLCKNQINRNSRRDTQTILEKEKGQLSVSSEVSREGLVKPQVGLPDPWWLHFADLSFQFALCKAFLKTYGKWRCS